jgi:hypothetical protein
MKPNPGVAAVQKLAHMGYRFTVNGVNIKAKYEGQGAPDPAQVRPLMALVKEHKVAAIGFLARKAQPPERVLTCADCPRFSASLGPNPRQAWGRCLKRGRGRYGCATACEAALTDDVVDNANLSDDNQT